MAADSGNAGKHPGLQFEFQQAYYEGLCEAENVKVDWSDPTRGKRLVCTREAAPDETVLRERNCVAAQNLDDRLEGIPVCGHCLKSLETLLENCVRVRGKLSTQQGSSKKERLFPISPADFPRFEQAPTPTKLFCTGSTARPDYPCREAYCNTACRARAWTSYHAVLCPQNTKFTKKNDPVREYYEYTWTQGGINFADTFHVAFVIFAHVMCGIKFNSLTAQKSWEPFSYFVSAPWDETSFDYLLTEDDKSDDDHVTKPELVKAALGLLRRVHSSAIPFPNVQPQPSAASQNSTAQNHNHSKGKSSSSQALVKLPQDVEFMFEEGFFSRLLGMILLNGQERTPSSPFSLYRMEILSDYPNEDPVVQDLYNRICGRKSTIQDRELLNYSSMGQGIYCIGACMNHSCDPNVAVVYNDLNDEELVVQARRHIQAGEELCISYIDESGPFTTRQHHLRNHYLFTCQCSLCCKQRPAASIQVIRAVEQPAGS